MNLGEIRTDVRSLADERNETAVLLNSEINTYINRRYMDICNAIIEIHNEYFGATSTESTIKDQQEYNLPTDSDSRDEMRGLKRVEIAYDGTNYHQARYIDLIEKVDTESTTTAYSQFQPYFYMWGNKIGFLPIPDSTQTNNIKFWYVQRPAILVTDTDIPVFDDSFHYILSYGTVADVKRKEGDAQDYILIKDMERQYEKGLGKLVHNIQPRVLIPKYVKDVTDIPARLNEDWVQPGSLT